MAAGVLRLPQRLGAIVFVGLKLSGAVWKWGLIAAMLLVIVWQAGLVATFRIIEFPQEAFTSEYNLGDAPLWLA